MFEKRNALVWARQFKVDEQYCAVIADLAEKLYEQFCGLGIFKHRKTDFDLSDFKMLRVAAILHESGKFLSFNQYHRHSQYLIANSKILGFSGLEKSLLV